jgi:hypothetical protein
MVLTNSFAAARQRNGGGDPRRRSRRPRSTCPEAARGPDDAGRRAPPAAAARRARRRRRCPRRPELGAAGRRPPEGEAAAEKKDGEMTFVPIPEIILDPNEGNTYGLLGVVLLTDEKDEIKYMIAPDVRFNETKGVFPNLRLFGYPTPTQRYSVLIGKSTTRDENYEIEFSERGLLDKKAFVLAHFLYERDSTERFFGFGNDSEENRESNYTDEDLYMDATPGYWILPQVNLSYRMRIRRYNVQPGQVDSVPDITDPCRGPNGQRIFPCGHPEVRGKGLESAVYWQHRLSVTYDSRDSMDMPTDGTYANAYIDGADRSVGSHTSFVAFGVELRDFIPFRGEKRNPILAMRALVDYLQGDPDTPFWLRNTLGGRRTLRGFGGRRFTDFNRALVTMELRTRVYERRIFGVNGELELAPFIEAGQVFHHLSDSPVDDLHLVGGLGFRALVRPQLVAFVDVGYGEEGDSIFTGIDYPF